MLRLRQWSSRPAVLLACSAALAAGGCATHADKLLPAVQHASAGDYEAGISTLNAVLRVGTAEELPEKWGAERALAALDRAVLLQSLGRYGASARNISAAEHEIELIDLTKDPVGSLATYLYSGSAKAYRAPPSERLALNVINLLNYLADGDLEGAAVEARRYQAMREYLASVAVSDHGVAAFGAYLAGFVFEHLREGDRSLRYYEDALELGALRSLAQPVSRLARTNAFRGPRLESLLSSAQNAPASHTGAEILIVLSVGRVSHKVAERIPIGAAFGLAGTHVTRDIDWLKYGATKVVVYPELVSTPSSLGKPAVRVDGRDVGLELLIDLDGAVRREYDDLKPRIIAAALTRMASRAATAEGIRAAGGKESKLLGDVLAIVVEGALVGLDRPDTRSWLMMPARVLVARVPVAPGPHDVDVSFGNEPRTRRRSSIDVRAGGYGAVVVTEPR